MGCNCGKKSSSAQSLGWTVDLVSVTKRFDDGSSKKTYATLSEAQGIIAKLGLIGKVRPRPATASD